MVMSKEGGEKRKRKKQKTEKKNQINSKGVQRETTADEVKWVRR